MSRNDDKYLNNVQNNVYSHGLLLSRAALKKRENIVIPKGHPDYYYILASFVVGDIFHTHCTSLLWLLVIFMHCNSISYT